MSKAPLFGTCVKLFLMANEWTLVAAADRTPNMIPTVLTVTCLSHNTPIKKPTVITAQDVNIEWLTLCPPVISDKAAVIGKIRERATWYSTASMCCKQSVFKANPMTFRAINAFSLTNVLVDTDGSPSSNPTNEAPRNNKTATTSWPHKKVIGRAACLRTTLFTMIIVMEVTM